MVLVDGWNIPIYDALKKYASLKPVPFHMPGHKLGKGIPALLLKDLASMDVTEIPGTDNLHSPHGIIMEAQELAADAFGADETFFLVNGSSCGIQAAIAALCKPGEKLIIGRDCHKSVISGAVASGCVPIYIKPGYVDEFKIPGTINPQDIEKVLNMHTDARAVLITRPGYYGICSDIKEIARIVHSYGKVLIVDEAHGAHLVFNKKLPVCALEAGADISIQSAHKTLPAFTQGAYLHTKSGRVDMERLKFYLSMFQTTSPSYIIMVMLDIARELMVKKGRELIDGLLENIERFQTAVSKIGGLMMLTNDYLNDAEMDRTRITINAAKTGMTGFQMEYAIRHGYNIYAEMADLFNVVFITTVADGKEELDALLMGLEKTVGTAGSKSLSFDVPDMLPEQALTPQEAVQAGKKRVKLDEALGMICKDIITPYPPGIPLICPGEIIRKDDISYILSILKAGGNVCGIGKDLKVDVVL